MEKKEIDKKFFLLSSVNIIPAAIFGGGLTLETLYFIIALIILVINHGILVKLVKSVTVSASEGHGGAEKQWYRILLLMFLKFCLLFGLIGTFYYFKKELIIKLFFLIFLQLIIQIVSIKNNYQNS
jgi:hypothetical protein